MSLREKAIEAYRKVEDDIERERTARKQKDAARRAVIENGVRMAWSRFAGDFDGDLKLIIEAVTSYGESYTQSNTGLSRIPAEVIFRVDDMRFVAREDANMDVWGFWYLYPGDGPRPASVRVGKLSDLGRILIEADEREKMLA